MKTGLQRVKVDVDSENLCLGLVDVRVIVIKNQVHAAEQKELFPCLHLYGVTRVWDDMAM